MSTSSEASDANCPGFACSCRSYILVSLSLCRYDTLSYYLPPASLTLATAYLLRIPCYQQQTLRRYLVVERARNGAASAQGVSFQPHESAAPLFRALLALYRSTAFSLLFCDRLRFLTPFPLLGPTTFGNLSTNWPPPADVVGAAASEEAGSTCSSPPRALAFAARRLASLSARWRARSAFLRFGRSADEKCVRRRSEYDVRKASLEEGWTCECVSMGLDQR